MAMLESAVMRSRSQASGALSAPAAVLAGGIALGAAGCAAPQTPAKRMRAERARIQQEFFGQTSEQGEAKLVNYEHRGNTGVVVVIDADMKTAEIKLKGDGVIREKAGVIPSGFAMAMAEDIPGISFDGSAAGIRNIPLAKSTAASRARAVLVKEIQTRCESIQGVEFNAALLKGITIAGYAEGTDEVVATIAFQSKTALAQTIDQVCTGKPIPVTTEKEEGGSGEGGGEGEE